MREGDRLRWKEFEGETKGLPQSPFGDSPLRRGPEEKLHDFRRCREVYMPLKYNHGNIVLAKNLRARATKQENHLWYDFLSKYEIRFQRQKAIDNFIADFYCYKAKLIIEIDGTQHYTYEGQLKDEFRTEVLEGYDLKVIRFTNHQIDNNFRGVCEYIDMVVKGSVN